MKCDKCNEEMKEIVLLTSAEWECNSHSCRIRREWAEQIDNFAVPFDNPTWEMVKITVGDSNPNCFNIITSFKPGHDFYMQYMCHFPEENPIFMEYYAQWYQYHEQYTLYDRKRSGIKPSWPTLRSVDEKHLYQRAKLEALQDIERIYGKD